MIPVTPQNSASEAASGTGSDQRPPEVEEEIRESLLIHPTRQAILDKVNEKPGINKNQLRLELDVGLKVLDYHLTKMEDAEFVFKLPSAQGKEVLYFTEDNKELWNNPRTRIMFGRKPTRHVGTYIADHPGTDSESIAEALDLSVVTIRHHLRTLKDHDLIVSAKIGREVEYHPLSELKNWVEELGDRYERPWQDD